MTTIPRSGISVPESALGATLAAPFLANLIPYPFLLVAALGPLALAVVVAQTRPRIRQLLRDALSQSTTLLLWALFLFQLIGLLQSDSPFDSGLLRETSVALAIACLASVAHDLIRSRDSALRVFQSFMLVLVTGAVIFSIIGLIKLYLLQRGMVLGMVKFAYPTDYPWGSSIKRDYNFFALSILVASLGLMEYWFRARRNAKRIFFALLTGIVCTCGAYAGSRRFWLVAPVILLAGIVILWWRAPDKRSMSVHLIVFVLIACASGLVLAGFMEASARSETTTPGSFGGHTGESALGESFRQAMGADFVARAETLTSSADRFGTSSRTERWKYAIELLDFRTLLVGAGFDYRHSYSCRFLDCEIVDYPHNPILSSLLYGGILAAGFSLLFVCQALSLAFRLMKMGGLPSIAGLSLLSTFPFHLISGDTFSSLPGLLTMTILSSLLVVKRRSEESPKQAVVAENVESPRIDERFRSIRV